MTEVHAAPEPVRHVLLFSGHMVDAPTRAQPRFPAHSVAAATRAIEQALAALDADAADVAYTQGAAGGDLIFARACQRRGVRLQLLLPLPEAEFIAQSVLPSSDGLAWRDQFIAVKSGLATPPRQLQDEPGAAPAGGDVFVRCNEWLLATALQHGADRLHFICLWDGGGGDGPGGTRHMVDEVRRRHGQVVWIDPRSL